MPWGRSCQRECGDIGKLLPNKNKHLTNFLLNLGGEGGSGRHPAIQGRRNSPGGGGKNMGPKGGNGRDFSKGFWSSPLGSMRRIYGNIWKFPPIQYNPYLRGKKSAMKPQRAMNSFLLDMNWTFWRCVESERSRAVYGKNDTPKRSRPPPQLEWKWEATAIRPPNPRNP